MHLQRQQEDEWCWAAVAVSVDQYFNDASARTQCDLVSDVLGVKCCGDSDDCDKPNDLEKALGNKIGVGKLREPVQNRALEFAEIRDQLAQGFPVCVRIEWPDGGGHFVVIDGADTVGGVQAVHIQDPLHDATTISYRDFLTRYRLVGRWTDTYLVQP